jgi:hypothetical protein
MWDKRSMNSLVNEIVAGVKRQCNNFIFALPELKVVTHEEFREFDDILVKRLKKECGCSSVTPFHGNKMKVERRDGEEAACRVTGGFDGNIHVSVFVRVVEGD